MKDWLLNLNIAKKLMAAFMFIGLGSFTVIAVLALYSFTDNHQQQTIKQLELLRDAKIQQFAMLPTNASDSSIKHSLKRPANVDAATNIELVSAEQFAKIYPQLQQSSGNQINADTWLAYAQVSVSNRSQFLVISLADDVAGQPVRTIQLIMAIIAILGIGFNLAFAWFVATTFSRPISAMANTFARITKEGNFSLRSPDMHRTDEIGQMGQAMDQHLSALEQSIDEANQVVDHIAHGRFDHRMQANYVGDFNKLKQGINASAESVADTMQALYELMNAIASGNFAYRLQGVDMEGEFRDTLDRTMATMQEAIGEIAEVMEAAAQGDFSQQIDMDLAGDMARLKNSINSSIHAINESLTETADVAQSMAFGNLTRRIEGDYDGRLGDLKTALNSSVENMENTVGAVLSASNSVADNSAEISRGSEQLSQRTQSQTQSLEASANSMTAMADTITATAQQAEQAQELVTATHNSADEGTQLMAEAIKAMQAIETSSEKISAIVNFIDGIAFQTNLLALNASIEAARAGEHGHGFAVVAGEVRTLAQDSAESAKDIKKLVEDSVVKVSQGKLVITQVSDSFDEINGSVVKVHDLVEQIEAATGQQKEMVEQINDAVKSLEELNQQNVALVEESSASSYSLSEQTLNLKQQISFFKVANKQAIDTPVANKIANRIETTVINLEDGEQMTLQSTEQPAPELVTFDSLPPAQDEEQWDDF